MEKLNKILKGLRNNGHRYSLIRENILDFIAKSQKPLSYFDLQKLLDQKKLSVNKTTIYRELNLLKEQKIIKDLQFKDGIKYYELMPEGHHHHIICNQCEAIDHIELKRDLYEEEESIFKNNKFKVLTHSLEFYGICSSCINSKD